MQFDQEMIDNEIFGEFYMNGEVVLGRQGLIG